MNDAEHRKRLLIQRIADHRDLLSRELEVIQSSNPLLSAIRSTRGLLGFARAFGTRRRWGEGAVLSALNAELVTSVLPDVLRILRVILRRREERRAAGKPS